MRRFCRNRLWMGVLKYLPLVRRRRSTGKTSEIIYWHTYTDQHEAGLMKIIEV